MNSAAHCGRRILVIGGTGLIGGHAALRLKDVGAEVTITSRRPPPESSALAALPFVKLDYVADDVQPGFFAGFDAIVFAAGNDFRHVPAGHESSAHWEHANSVAIPAFLAKAKAAGVRQAILIGSWYPQVAPSLIETDPYVASRLRADVGSRALNSESFKVVVLNAPYVVGMVPGLPIAQNSLYCRWAMGQIPKFPRFTVPGGVNVISTDTLSDAIIGALDRGEGGQAYLIGDENLTFQQYFGLYFRAAGDDRPLEVRNEYHQLISDAVVCRAPRSTMYIDNNSTQAAKLGYRQRDVERTIRMIVEDYKTSAALN